MWRPAVYERFAAERALPFHELLALVTRSTFDRVVDLGCGTGELTAVAVERLAPTRAVGIDSSPAMLERSAAHAGPSLRFELGDLSEWTANGDHDLVLANASLQWVPDHRGVLRRWVAGLAPGGQLAVQVPYNADHPSHVHIRRTAELPRFVEALGGEIPADPVAEHVLAPEAYAELLHDLGAVEQHVSMRVYPHLLESSSAVVDWTRGTSLTRFARRLDPATFEDFAAAYRRSLLGELGDRSPYFYGFKRILIWARFPG
ncbi:MAG: methyltransferase domain-containing protein [Ilumatobacteraceae bacterium]